jgi:hypothetical protein
MEVCRLSCSMGAGFGDDRMRPILHHAEYTESVLCVSSTPERALEGIKIAETVDPNSQMWRSYCPPSAS